MPLSSQLCSGSHICFLIVLLAIIYAFTVYMNIHSVLPQSMKIHLSQTSKAAAGNFVHARRVICQLKNMITRYGIACTSLKFIFLNGL